MVFQDIIYIVKRSQKYDFGVHKNSDLLERVIIVVLGDQQSLPPVFQSARSLSPLVFFSLWFSIRMSTRSLSCFVPLTSPHNFKAPQMPQVPYIPALSFPTECVSDKKLGNTDGIIIYFVVD